MDRRELLAVGAATALAGCLGYRVVERDAVTDRRVRLAELEATLDARETRIAELEAEVGRLRRRLEGPRINAVGTVDHWERTGDVVVRGVDEVAAGSPLTVAVSFTYPVHGNGGTGQVDVGLDVVVSDADGRTVASGERDVRLVLDTDARLAELPVRFERGFSPGRYAAAARVTDRVTGIDVESRSVAFRVR